MAQRIVVQKTDDIDGSAAPETVTFALDGTTYEIDLSEANAAPLREAGGLREHRSQRSPATTRRQCALGRPRTGSNFRRVAASPRPSLSSTAPQATEQPIAPVVAMNS